VSGADRSSISLRDLHHLDIILTLVLSFFRRGRGCAQENSAAAVFVLFYSLVISISSAYSFKRRIDGRVERLGCNSPTSMTRLTTARRLLNVAASGCVRLRVVVGVIRVRLFVPVTVAQTDSADE
jgi:hypothetical protein